MVKTFNINDLVRDRDTGEMVLVTNLIAVDPSALDERYVPYEGLVFVTTGDRMVTWGMQNIRSRELRPATTRERETLLPQYKARLKELARPTRKRRT